MTVTAMPPAVGAVEAEGAEGEKKGGKKKKIMIILVLVLVIAGAGWFFFLKPAGAPEEPKPGEVVTLESIQLNLAAGHYLRLGLALQLSEEAPELDGSKALDAAIGTFSGLKISDVITGEQREELRETLEGKLEKAYHGDVLEVYFTEFVTQ